MRRIDLLIGGVIILAIIFSFVGVATYEAAPGDNNYDVTWASRSHDFTAQGQRANDGSTTVDVPVKYDNLTKVDLTIRVTGTGARANDVAVQIKVEPVNGTAQTQSAQLPRGTMGNTPEVKFAIEFGQPPNATTASGADENATLDALAKDHTSKKGSGTWRVTFTVTGSNPSTLPTGTNAYTFNIAGKAATYYPTLQPATPDINR